MLLRLTTPALLIVAAVVASLPARAQQPIPAGVATICANATIGSTPLSNGTTIFSGDLLRTADNGQLQVQSGTIQLVLSADSAVRIFRTGDRVLVELERGSVSYSSKGVSENLSLYAQDIKFVPKTTEFASGQIVIVSHCEVKASAVRSTIEATSGRETKTIESNQTYSAVSEIGVDYKESWKPVLQDYPEYPRDAQYHHSHNHVACAPAAWQGHRPPLMGATSHFNYLAAATVGVVTTVVTIKALESPDKP